MKAYDTFYTIHYKLVYVNVSLPTILYNIILCYNCLVMGVPPSTTPPPRNKKLCRARGDPAKDPRDKTFIVYSLKFCYFAPRKSPKKGGQKCICLVSMEFTVIF